MNSRLKYLQKKKSYGHQFLHIYYDYEVGKK